MTKNTALETRQTIIPPLAARRRLPVAGLSVLALAVLNKAMAADDVSTLTSQATSGVSGISSAVMTIAGVVLTIGLIVWATRKLKPHG